MLISALAVSLLSSAPTLAVDPGPHPVGFRAVDRVDASRRRPDGGPWVVQVGVWYPARAAGRSPMTYGDYVAEASRNGGKSADPAAAEGYLAFLARHGVSRDAGKALLAAPMRSGRDATAETGRFPVVLLAQGNGGAVQDQAAFAEHLAGHGFVVATTPSPARLGLPIESEADVPALARAQAADLEQALAALADLTCADRSRIAVAGYSFGGRAALVFAGRHPEVRALLSLDSGLASAEAKGWLAPSDLDRGVFKVPVLHLAHDPSAGDVPRTDWTLLDSLAAAPRTVYQVDGLRHLDLVTAGAAVGRLPAFGGPETAERTAAVMALGRAFLAAHTGGDGRPWTLAAEDPTRAGFRAGLFRARTQPAPAESWEAREAMFAYDWTTPLDVKEVGRETRGAGTVVRDVTFVAAPGTAPIKAYIVSPAGDGPFAGVLWMHWLGEPETTNRSQFLKEAVALAERGAVSVLPDAMWSAPEWYGNRVPEEDHASSIRQVIAIRRAFDLLVAQPGVDRARVGFVGHDYGGMYGIIASGVEPRARTYVFIATAQSLNDWAFFGRQPVSKAAYLRQNAELELTDYLHRIRNASTLFQMADKDIYVARTDTAVLLAAASAPKERRFYDADHAMTAAKAATDRTEWLVRELGLAR